MGRELDALMAERAMRWPIIGHTGAGWASEDRGLPMFESPTGTRVPGSADWSPSTDIVAAWEVVEAMRAKGYSFSIRSTPEGKERVTFYENWTAQPKSFKAEGLVQEAICRAALSALGVEVPANV